MTDKATHTPLPCPLCQSEAPQVYESRFDTHCNDCGARAPTRAWNTRHAVNSYHDLIEALRAMIEVAHSYAEYISSVPSAELERHPYLPGLEDQINEARAKIDAILTKEAGHG